MNTLQWLEKLISFDTVSSNSNRPLIEEINKWFKLHQVHTQIIPGPSESKVNLLATIPAKNGDTQGGIILSGHSDVVPVLGQLWDTDPFTAVMDDNGRVYGRGTCDMKGFLAVLLALTPEFKTLNLAKPIHLAFTCDEEVGCIGVDYLVDYLQRNNIRPEGCIIGEPSGMRPIIGEKGRRLYHCQIQGKAVHSSLTPIGCNAVEFAARLINYIHKLAAHTQEHGPFDNAFDFPFTTISINLVSGGIATNIVPGTCEFIVELRYIDEFPIVNFYHQIINYIDSELVPQMKKSFLKAAIYFDETSDGSGFNASEDAHITRVVRTVTGVKERFKVSYSTEASAYQNAHIPTLICGPGDIQQAHSVNEYITVEQLGLCEKVLKNVIHFFCVDLQKILKN